MTLSFLILAVLTIAGMSAAMSLRNLVHCVLALTLGLTGLAALYLQLGVQFVGFAQVLVYVGAVAILVVFVIMMTRSSGRMIRPALSSWITGSLIAGSVFAVLAWAIGSSAMASRILPPKPEATVHQIGDALMRQFVLPLEIIGLLLTVALVGAVVLAMHEKRRMQ
jgi:NADH-quinone oxidoreductase subunit J